MLPAQHHKRDFILTQRRVIVPEELEMLKDESTVWRRLGEDGDSHSTTWVVRLQGKGKSSK